MEKYLKIKEKLYNINSFGLVLREHLDAFLLYWEMTFNSA